MVEKIDYQDPYYWSRGEITERDKDSYILALLQWQNDSVDREVKLLDYLRREQQERKLLADRLKKREMEISELAKTVISLSERIKHLEKLDAQDTPYDEQTHLQRLDEGGWA